MIHSLIMIDCLCFPISFNIGFYVHTNSQIAILDLSPLAVGFIAGDHCLLYQEVATAIVNSRMVNGLPNKVK
jgi:hypothetical protein